MLAKTVFSNVTRLLVVVGLEGTGHHFFNQLLWTHWGDAKDSVPTVQAAQLVGNWNQYVLERQNRDSDFAKRLPYRLPPVAHSRGPRDGLRNGSSAPHYGGWSREYLMANVAALQKSIDKYRYSGMLLAVYPLFTSWPNGHGSHIARKNHMRPSIPLLAEAAERAGADLRVLVLQRNAVDTLTAVCVHRIDLEPCALMADTLAANAQALANDLGQIDSAFYLPTCMTYGDLDSITKAIEAAIAGSAAGKRVHVSDVVRRNWRSRKEFSARYRQYTRSELEGMAARYDLETATSAIHKRCAPQESVASNTPVRVPLAPSPPTQDTSQSLRSSAHHRQDGVVRKTVFSTTSRLLFVAGLEGVGHHFFATLFEHDWDMPTQKPNERGVKRTVREVRLVGNWNQRGLEIQAQRHYGREPLPAGWTNEHLEANVKLLRQAKHSRAGVLLGVYPLSTSWPNGHATHAVRMSHMRPDIVLMAEAAEEAGVDLRVLLLHRDGPGTLAANCLHRLDLEDCAGQAETLTTNAKALAEQLARIDRAFYLPGCIDYGDLDSIIRGLRWSVADTPFAATKIDEVVKRSWIWTHSSKKCDRSQKCYDDLQLEVLARNLSVAMTSLDLACTTQSSPRTDEWNLTPRLMAVLVVTALGALMVAGLLAACCVRRVARRDGSVTERAPITSQVDPEPETVGTVGADDTIYV
mmetsp:Transcript_58777/g.164057  ORF Transcript_58777/g.164057 Transcript_58777/m.164057 type:complete len:693 (-) Transcript_58777:33-2111(-)